MRRWPSSFIALTALGCICLVTGVLALLGLLQGLHPLFADSSTALALIVSAVALLLSGAFPLVLQRLAEKDCAAAVAPTPSEPRRP